MNNDKDNATLYAELKAERFMTDQISLLHEAEDLADGINFMLKSIGEFTDADRAYVEDNELNLEIAVFSLEAAGLNVSTAINGLEAVRLFEKSKPYEYDIILMDIMMPVMNGLDAAKAIRGLSRPDATTVPIIALSANAFAEDIQKSKNAGINEHLAKPLEMDKVLKVIASYCK